MFLETPGSPFKKERFKAHSFFDGPVADEVLGYQKPDHLVALKDSMWPEEVIEKIAQQFKAIGLQDPGRQKLVEPYAVAFGGMNIEGKADFTNVNWQMVVDYFTWEAACHDENRELSRKLQEQAKKKYGGTFTHYIVYEGLHTNTI